MQTKMLSFLRSRAAWLLGVAVLGLSQVGCAHPVWVEPSVAVHARVGGPVYGPVYGPPPVVVAQPPVWVPAPPVFVPPRVVVPAYVDRPAWGHGHHHHQGRGWGESRRRW